MIGALVAVLVTEPGARVWPYNSSDGTPVDTDKLVQSDWLAGAYSIWLHHQYAISVDCSPPRACYANSQLVNYHFNCARGFAYVRERISMDLNGNVVNHQVFAEPAPPSPFDSSPREAFVRVCAPQDYVEDRFGNRR